MTLDHPPSFRLRYLAARHLCAPLRWCLTSRTMHALEDSGWCRARGGIHGYALSAAAPPTVLAKHAAPALFSQWAAHWGVATMSRPVLVEKSPSNSVMALWLHAAWASTR